MKNNRSLAISSILNEKCKLKDLPFPPKEDFIYKFYTNNKAILIDKKGRVYNRWSTGRKRNNATNQETDIA